MDPELIDFIFTYHPPKSEQKEIYDALSVTFGLAARELNKLLPEGAGKTVAIRKLAAARMAANAAVALEGRF